VAIHPSARVHPRALVEEGAEIGAEARIGPFAVIGPEVRLGPGAEVRAHAVVTGATEIGADAAVFPFAVVGEVPQDLKYRGEPTCLVVGARTRIREHATLNTGTAAGGGVTRVGEDCLIMAGAHVAHDCRVGDRVIMVNNSALAGHCVVEDEVILGGLSGVHQWVRLGRGAIVGAVTMVTHDVIPYGLVQGPRGRLDGLNLVGLKRAGVPRADITALRAAFQALAQGEGTFQDRARRLGEETESAYVRRIVDFVTGASDRSFLTPE
jgi:UDP-N-acetylglucosamine acyltransferase